MGSSVPLAVAALAQTKSGLKEIIYTFNCTSTEFMFGAHWGPQVFLALIFSQLLTVDRLALTELHEVTSLMLVVF